MQKIPIVLLTCKLQRLAFRHFKLVKQKVSELRLIMYRGRIIRRAYQVFEDEPLQTKSKTSAKPLRCYFSATNPILSTSTHLANFYKTKCRGASDTVLYYCTHSDIMVKQF